ncbi:MAG: methyltransferase domain-containing protein [Candidatus Altiarchaeota archaeon]
MDRRLLDFLACPSCKGDFKCTPFLYNKEEIVDGLLTCNCGNWYPIIGGIPRILPNTLKEHPSFAERYRDKLPEGIVSDRDIQEFKKFKESTSKSFGFQWTKYKIINEMEESPIFFDKTGVDEKFLKGKLCLDGGCGYGRYSLVAAKHGAEIVAVDLSQAVESAYENTRGVGRVHVVQADLFNIPLREGTFDFVYSIGVLHHTPDPKGAFKCISKMVKRGGLLAVWVYRKRSPLSMFLNNVIRVFTTRMPIWMLWRLSWVGVPLGGLVRGIGNEWLRLQVGRLFFFISKRPYPEERWADTFDWWSPEYEHFHTEGEVRGWLEGEGYSKLKLNRRREDDIGRKNFRDDIGFSGIK